MNSNKSELFGQDLKIVDRYPGKDLTSVESVRQKKDFGLAEGIENLAQALSLRVITSKGMLRKLGHSNYGSRVPELIGELNNSTNRKLLELYTREAIMQDPRVKEITEINVQTSQNERSRVDIHVSLIPIENAMPLNFIVPFYFE